jgi:hypothetical protein
MLLAEPTYDHDALYVMLEGFDFIPATNSYYLPIFEPISWGDATQLCQKLNPFARLVIIRNVSEFYNLVTYLSSIPGERFVSADQ